MGMSQVIWCPVVGGDGERGISLPGAWRWGGGDCSVLHQTTSASAPPLPQQPVSADTLREGRMTPSFKGKRVPLALL